MRRTAAVLLLLVLVAAGCASDQRPRLGTAGATTRPGPAIRQDEPTGSTAVRSAPRWETVVSLSGTTGGEPVPITILPDAIQWRVRWTCQSGTFRVTTTPPPRRPGPTVGASCPGKGDGYSILTGDIRLGIEASGPWTAVVDQQVETPLDEQPLPEMAAAPVVAKGGFYNMEKTGAGEARLYRLGDGRRFLRFEGFSVTQNTDLFVWLSESPHPNTSAEAVEAKKVVLGNLKSTLGNQNYELPADLPTERIRSIVIWCQPVAIAYSAAALTA